MYIKCISILSTVRPPKKKTKNLLGIGLFIRQLLSQIPTAKQIRGVCPVLRIVANAAPVSKHQRFPGHGCDHVLLVGHLNLFGWWLFHFQAGVAYIYIYARGRRFTEGSLSRIL